MASLFGASWFCLLLAGLWSLLCGYFLRRAWTSEADEEGALRLASLRNDAARLRSDVELRNGQVRTLETELGNQRSRFTEIEGLLSAKDTEMQTLGGKLSGIESKAAGFDLARLGALKTIEEREQAMSAQNARLRSLEAELSDAKAQAEAARTASAHAATAAGAELVNARRGWDAERSKLLGDHGSKLSLLDNSRIELEKSKGSEIAALLAKVAGLAVFESQARELAPKLESSLAAVRAKDKDMAALEQRLHALEPLTAKLAAAEAELAAAKRGMAERDTALNGLNAEKSSAAQALKQRDDELAKLRARVAELEPLQAKASQAEAELVRVRARITELEPWKSKFESANTDLAKLRARIGELEPLQAKFSSANTELGTLRTRLAELAPLQAKFTQADSELGRLRVRIAELEPWQAKSRQWETELGQLRPRISELEPWKLKFSEAEAELGRLRARVAAAEPWQAKFEGANAELGKLRARVGELEPWQAKFGQADAELGRLRSLVTELQPLQEQLRVASINHEAAQKQKDDRAARVAAEFRERIASLDTERADWRRRGESAQQQVVARDAEIQELLRRIEALRNAPPKVIERIVEVEKVVTVMAPAAAPVAARPAAPAKRRDSGAGRRDDLKVIEGIGPKIEQLLNNAGYLTFRSVAEADAAALAVILEAAGPRFKLARTDTWPQQAGLLADNNMAAFKTLTDALKGGVKR